MTADVVMFILVLLEVMSVPVTADVVMFILVLLEVMSVLKCSVSFVIVVITLRARFTNVDQISVQLNQVQR